MQKYATEPASMLVEKESNSARIKTKIYKVKFNN